MLRWQGRASAGDLFVAQEQIRAAASEIHFDHVTRLQDGEISSGGRFWSRMQNRGAIGSAALSAVTEAGQHIEALAHQRSGGVIFTTSAEPGNPMGPVPRTTSMQVSSMFRAGLRCDAGNPRGRRKR